MSYIKRLMHRSSARTSPGSSPAGPLSHLIVGLGNPGPRYESNRHNIGFQCVDHLARLYGAEWQRSRFKATTADARIGPHRVLLVKPLTFMNDSGDAVAAASRWYKIPPERVLVIYDDLDLALARIRLRPGGSSGGHNGIASIIARLGTTEFPRLRIGIGRPTRGDPVDYVLNDFSRDQEPLVQGVYEVIDEIVRCFLNQGIREAMNSYNGRDMVPSVGAD